MEIFISWLLCMVFLLAITLISGYFYEKSEESLKMMSVCEKLESNKENTCDYDEEIKQLNELIVKYAEKITNDENKGLSFLMLLDQMKKQIIKIDEMSTNQRKSI